MKHIYLTIFVFILMIPFCQVFSQDWTLEKSSDGIIVYTAAVAGSKYKVFKAQMRLKTSLTSCFALLDDAANFTAWMYEIPEAKTLKKISETKGYNYLVYHLPWPFDDRDMIIHYTIKQDDKKSVFIDLAGSGDYINPIDGRVRVSILKGHWRFVPENGMTLIEYQLHLEPNGEIPAWLANSTVVNTPYHSFLKMKTTITNSKYQNAKADWLKE